MPVSTLREARELSPQTLANFALEADRGRRRAILAGDLAAAVEYQRERDKLAAMSRAY